MNAELPPEVAPERLAEAQALAQRAQLPALLDDVCLGTAGWTDPSLIKCHRFYPRGKNSPEDRLRFYATQFELVEVDATYYTLLDPRTVARWVEWTPASFRFDVKSHPVLTGHPIDIARAPNDLVPALREVAGDKRRLYPRQVPREIREELIARFLAQLAPLVDAGRLGCVMLQFPPWFHATRGNARQLESLRRELGGLPLSVEFRNRSWLLPERRARVLDLLRREQLSYVIVDEPDVQLGGVPPEVLVTRPELALFRLHGHNREGWKRGSSVWERFDYLYSPAELRAWVPAVREVKQRAERVHVVFNNCVRDYAVLGAKGLAALLQRPAEDAPSGDAFRRDSPRGKG
ncbi:MAG: DUF72 domain-containing protein [Myxococcales bacterium]|nr:DUF72 domain-containing protein [Myxococcales bacterium]